MPVVCAVHGEALAPQKFREERAKLGIVVHQQDVHG
jgi:hypothetical protein